MKTFFGKVLLASLTSSMLVASMLPLAVQAGEVYNREHNQQARINQGVRNGSLTYGKYRRDENHLDAVNAQRRYDLRHNDGHLTAGQYHQINHELNNNSQRIDYTKHNLPRQP
ncbi:MAG TPA: hypothetical protein VGG22_13025 [Candidatus Baltobacteraceae bacterium]|jgi:hypothetical protein